MMPPETIVTVAITPKTLSGSSPSGSIAAAIGKITVPTALSNCK